MSRRLAACRFYLLIAQGPLASVSDAARCEYLDDVRTIGRQLLDEGSDLIGSAGIRGHGLKRGEHPRTWDLALNNEVSELCVESSAETLHRREAGPQHLLGVPHGVEHRLALGLPVAGPVRLTVRVEVGGQMHVGVDPPGHHDEVG